MSDSPVEQVQIHGRTPPAPLSLSGHALTFGLAAALATWTAAFLAYAISNQAPGELVGPLLLAVLAAGAFFAGRLDPSGRGWQGGLLVAALASALNLMILGSLLVRETSAPPLAPLAVFLAASLALGALAGRIGRRHAPSRDWLSPLAWTVAASVFALLILGGSVTSTGSGMAVPDWPTSQGFSMFLFPLERMHERGIFLEHSHRLAGSFVGLASLALAVYVLAAEKRTWIKALAAATFVLVCVQGILGGQRVVMDQRTLGMIHGVGGQVVLALVVAIAVYTGEPWRRIDPAAGSRSGRRLSTGLFHALLLQLVLGAAYRHLGHAHVIYTHAAFAIVVLVFALAAGSWALRLAPAAGAHAQRPLRLAGAAMLVAVAFQFTIGWIALFAAIARDDRPAGAASPAWESLVATAHQANGALVLALAVVLMLLMRRAARLARAHPAD
jgi:cytochrome c oxidase assembly protein subunit 15